MLMEKHQLFTKPEAPKESWRRADSRAGTGAHEALRPADRRRDARDRVGLRPDMKALTVGSLFSGIGGFDLGFERAGFQVKWQVEIDPFCRAVLETHWPDVRRYEDVRTVGADLEPVDVICGGFPCQPHSLAGRRRASADERDLWGEFARIIRETRPRWVVAENVPGLLSSESGRFFGRVLRDLAESGYDAEWDCVPAKAVGAPHERDRVWLIAYPDAAGGGVEGEWLPTEGRQRLADTDWICEAQWPADTDSDQQHGRGGHVQVGRVWRSGEIAADVFGDGDQWRVEPNVGRVAHGVSARVDRLRGLGNAIVPQIAEWIARRIQEAEGLA
jgi:DNA (cytosine-5)-methyltransferase 1